MEVKRSNLEEDFECHIKWTVILWQLLFGLEIILGLYYSSSVHYKK